MLNPVIIPLPWAIAAILALIAALVLATAFMRAEIPTPWTGTPAAGGRHRLDTVAKPYRPRGWAAINADRIAREEQAAIAERWTAPLQIEAAGLPDREPILPGPLHVIRDITEQDTGELVAVA